MTKAPYAEPRIFWCNFLNGVKLHFDWLEVIKQRGWNVFEPFFARFFVKMIFFSFGIIFLALGCISASPVGSEGSMRPCLDPNSSTFSALHESLQDEILKNAFDQEPEISQKMNLIATNRFFLNTSNRLHPSVTVDLASPKAYESFSQLLCDRLKQKKSAVFEHFNHYHSKGFKYFQCFDNLEHLKINGMSSNQDLAALQYMPKLKSIEILVVNPIYIYGDETITLPEALPKQLESMKIVNPYCQVFKQINQSRWNSALGGMEKLKQFHVNCKWDIDDDNDYNLWYTIFGLSKLSHLSLDANLKESPLDFFQFILKHKPKSLTLDGVRLHNFWIEFVGYDKVIQGWNPVDWISALNELHFKHVDISLAISNPSHFYLIKDISNLQEINLSLIVGINTENSKHILEGLTTIAGDYKINELRLYFNEQYFSWFLLGLQNILQRPDKVKVFAAVRARDFENMPNDIETLQSEGFNIINY